MSSRPVASSSSAASAPTEAAAITSTAIPRVSSAWPVRASLACLLAVLAAFLAWQYAQPAGFESSFLLNHAGVEHFRATLGLPHTTMSVASYRTGFRVLLGALWFSYVALVFAAGAGGPLPRRRTLVLTILTVTLVTAFFWPPSFSGDVYGYIGYGRMKVLYGLNPYATTQHALVGLGDPTGPFLRWNIPSPYGPLWTSLSVAIAWLLRGASLWAQVVTMKLVAGAALVGAAWGGGRIAERLSPGRGDLALLAVGLNPLFVIEGAGNGHNDLVMMALVVAAVGAFLRGRALRAALWAGLAAGVKFLPLLLVPWIVLSGGHTRALPWRARVRDGLACALVALAPVALGYLPYWIGKNLLTGLQQRYHSGQTTSAAEAMALLVTYVVATVWLMRGEPGRVVGAWMAVAAAIFLLATGMWLPWYLSWIWLPALLRWNRRGVIASSVAFFFAIVLTLQYSVPAGG